MVNLAWWSTDHVIPAYLAVGGEDVNTPKPKLATELEIPGVSVTDLGL